MRKLLFFILFVVSNSVFSQNISGKVFFDNQVSVASVTIINLNNGQKSYSDMDGNFSINAQLGDEIRLVKPSYERASFIVKQNSNPVIINLIKITEIEPVIVKKAPTGNLETDTKNLGENLPKKKLNSDLRSYYKTYSTKDILDPKPGEFVQPVGPGIAIGAIDNQWTTTDFAIWIRTTLTENYFLTMDLKPSEIDTFIYYSLRDFAQAKILKYAYCSDKDLGLLTVHFEKKIKEFRK